MLCQYFAKYTPYNQLISNKSKLIVNNINFIYLIIDISIKIVIFVAEIIL